MTFKHTLLPVWIASYRYNNKVYNFMVNGETGRVQGEAPISWWKVALAVLITLLVFGCIIAALTIFERINTDSGAMLHTTLQGFTQLLFSVLGTPLNSP